MVRAEIEPFQRGITQEEARKQAERMAEEEWQELRGKDPIAWAMVEARETARRLFTCLKGESSKTKVLELPEVETIRLDLEKTLVGKRILGVWTDSPKQLHKPSGFGQKRGGITIIFGPPLKWENL